VHHDVHTESFMKQVSKSAIAIATFACAAICSVGWSERGGLSLSVDSAQARVGRPLTPVSVAGVARRQNRRAAYGVGYGYGYGPGAIGAAAVGTAVAVGAAAAAGPYYGGWGNNYGSTNWTDSYAAAQSDPHYGQPFYPHRAYYGQSPYYGYAGWQDYSTRNGIGCVPGTLTKLGDGREYICQ
jgi:hypothetical protein